MAPIVEIQLVNEEILDHLVDLAIDGADPDDVTPPLGDGWTQERIDWLRRFHRDRFAGFTGPLTERTWAVLEDGRLVGSVRLHQLAPSLEGEVGIWLTRATRGRGVGVQAVAAVIGVAAAVGLTTVMATTTSSNAAALALIERLDFKLTEQGEQVTAVLRIP